MATKEELKAIVEAIQKLSDKERDGLERTLATVRMNRDTK